MPGKKSHHGLLLHTGSTLEWMPTFRHYPQSFDDVTPHATSYAATAVGSAYGVTRLGLRDCQGSQPEAVLVWRNW